MAKNVAIRLTSPKRGSKGLSMISKKLNERSRKLVLEVAYLAIEEAVTHTPKWSGIATESWTFTTDNSSAYSNKYPDSPLIYEGGMYDSEAMTLNNEVIAANKRKIRAMLAASVRWNKSLSFYLVNEAAHSKGWLLDGLSSTPVRLRDVNADYYTMADIADLVEARYKESSANWNLRTRGGAW